MLRTSKIVTDTEKVLKDKIPAKHLKSFLNFLEHYEPGEYIYRQPVRRSARIPDDSANKILSLMEQNNIVEPYANIVCPDDECCHTFLVPLAEYKKRIEEEDMRCPACGMEVNYKNPQLVYRLINE